jgi:hypothetical protein
MLVDQDFQAPTPDGAVVVMERPVHGGASATKTQRGR